MVAHAINQQEPIFDCNDVERRLIRDHAIATAMDIIIQRNSGDPLRYFCAVLSKYIDTSFRAQLRKLVTPNLGGKPSKNQQWEKMVPAVVAPTMEPVMNELLNALTDEDLAD